MTYFLKQPNGIFLRGDNELLSVGKQLEVGTYAVNQDGAGNYFLTVSDPFTRPSKMYGNVNTQADRILATFNDRTVSTGVMLTGQQGSGKTMLARELSIKAAELGMPTLIVSATFHGKDFNAFIQSINMPALVLFDEFEKTYDDRDQEHLLTLLDGVYPTKKLFILTANNKYRINEHLFNRPGRIFYHLKYSGLDAAFVNEYVNDQLKNKQRAQSILDVYAVFKSFTFDMLKALVEEMNRFNISAHEALEMLNISTVHDDDVMFDVTLTQGGEAIDLNHEYWEGNPLTDNVRLDFGGNNPVTDEWELFQFTLDDLVSAKNGVYQFKKNDAVLTLSRQKDRAFNLSRAF